MNDHDEFADPATAAPAEPGGLRGDGPVGGHAHPLSPTGQPFDEASTIDPPRSTPATLADLQAKWPEAFALLLGTLQKLGAVEAELRVERALNEHRRAMLAGYRELVSGDGAAGSA
ncbi:MAG: hypothetical protein WAS21_20460 [Geminicoccaceae bacterium]